MASIRQLLQRLSDCGVEFVVVGGVAAELHGSARVTLDLDVCAPLHEENLKRIQAALRDLHPKFRMHPAKPPLFDDVSRLVGFRNLNLDTDWGVIDILGEITGIGEYESVRQHAVKMELAGMTLSVIDLPSLIQAKRATGRAKDRQALPELEHMLSRIRAKQDEEQKRGRS